MELPVLADHAENTVKAVPGVQGHDLPGYAVLLRHEQVPAGEVLPEALAIPVHLSLDGVVDTLEFCEIFFRDPLHGRVLRAGDVLAEMERIVLGILQQLESRGLHPVQRLLILRGKAHGPLTAGIPGRQMLGKLLQSPGGIPPDAAGAVSDVPVLRQIVVVEPALYRAVLLVEEDLVLRKGYPLPGVGFKEGPGLYAVVVDGVAGPGGVQGQLVGEVDVFVEIFLLQGYQHRFSLSFSGQPAGTAALARTMSLMPSMAATSTVSPLGITAPSALRAVQVLPSAYTAPVG